MNDEYLNQKTLTGADTYSRKNDNTLKISELDNAIRSINVMSENGGNVTAAPRFKLSGAQRRKLAIQEAIARGEPVLSNDQMKKFAKAGGGAPLTSADRRKIAMADAIAREHRVLSGAQRRKIAVANAVAKGLPVFSRKKNAKLKSIKVVQNIERNEGRFGISPKNADRDKSLTLNNVDRYNKQSGSSVISHRSENPGYSDDRDSRSYDQRDKKSRDLLEDPYYENASIDKSLTLKNVNRYKQSGYSLFSYRSDNPDYNDDSDPRLYDQRDNKSRDLYEDPYYDIAGHSQYNTDNPRNREKSDGPPYSNRDYSYTEGSHSRREEYNDRITSPDRYERYRRERSRSPLYTSREQYSTRLRSNSPSYRQNRDDFAISSERDAFTERNHEPHHPNIDTQQYFTSRDRSRSRSPLQRDTDSSYRRNRDSPYQRNRDSPYQRNRDSPDRPNSNSPYRSNRHSTYQRDTESPYRCNTDSSYRRNIDSPFIRDTVSSCQRNADSPYQPNRAPDRPHGYSPYRSNRDSTYQGDTDSPCRRNTDSPYQRNIDSPYRRDTDSPYIRDTVSPCRGKADSPYRRNIDSPYRQDTDSPCRRGTVSPCRGNADSPYRGNIDSPYRRDTISPYRRNTVSPYRHDIDSYSRSERSRLYESSSGRDKNRDSYERSHSPSYKQDINRYNDPGSRSNAISNWEDRTDFYSYGVRQNSPEYSNRRVSKENSYGEGSSREKRQDYYSYDERHRISNYSNDDISPYDRRTSIERAQNVQNYSGRSDRRDEFVKMITSKEPAIITPSLKDLVFPQRVDNRNRVNSSSVKETINILLDAPMYPEDTSTKFAIIPGSFPKTAFTKMQTQWLIQLINSYNQPEKGENSPRFKEVSSHDGILVVTCGNLKTKVWLEKVVATMHPWDNCKIRTASLDELTEKPIIATLLVPDPVPTKTSRVLFDIIKTNNVGLNTQKWKILDINEFKNGIKVLLTLDKQSLENLEKINMQLSLGTTKAVMTLCTG